MSTHANSHPPRPDGPEALRVLYLGLAFPRPGGRSLGPWALRQAHSLRKHGVEVTVVSFTIWTPRFLGRLGLKSGTVSCPPEYDWDGVRALYPRWLYRHRGSDTNLAYTFPAPFELLAWACARGALDRIVARFRPRLIHAHHMTPSGQLAFRASRRYGIPFVLTEHNVKEIPHYVTRPLRRAVARRVVGAAARWIALSTAAEREMRLAFPGARTVVVPNGTDPPPEEVLGAERPEALADALIVLCVAGFYPVKNVPMLIRAFASLASKHPRAVLRICGEGEDRPAVEATIREVGMAGRVLLVGAVPQPVAQREMATADIVVLASTFDTYPTVCLEAAAVGKPQVWPRNSGISDRLRDGVHGYVADTRSRQSIADGIDRLLMDPEKRAVMGAAARRLFLEELSWDVVTPRLISVYRESIAEYEGEQRPEATRARPR